MGLPVAFLVSLLRSVLDQAFPLFPPAFKLSEAVFYAIDAGVQAAMKAALVRAVKNPLFVFPANMRWFPHGLFLLRLRATHVPAVVTVHRRPWAYFVHVLSFLSY